MGSAARANRRLECAPKICCRSAISATKWATDPGHITTTMPGNLVDVLKQEGDTVTQDQAVLITEAMKMESEIHTSVGGTVQAVHVSKADRVTPGEVLIEIA